MIVAFGHKQNSGKDTACNYLKYYYKFTHRAFATSLKRSVKGMLLNNILELETQDQKNELCPILGMSYRRILQKAGDCLKKEFGEELFCKVLQHDISTLIQVKNVAISDMRSFTEFAYIQSLGGYCVRIDRPTDTPRTDTHRTELELDAIPNDNWDYIIRNDSSIEEFTRKIDAMLKHFGYEEPAPENQEG